jgi:hypothetical protein
MNSQKVRFSSPKIVSRRRSQLNWISILHKLRSNEVVNYHRLKSDGFPCPKKLAGVLGMFTRRPTIEIYPVARLGYF